MQKSEYKVLDEEFITGDNRLPVIILNLLMLLDKETGQYTEMLSNSSAQNNFLSRLEIACEATLECSGYGTYLCNNNTRIYFMYLDSEEDINNLKYDMLTNDVRILEYPEYTNDRRSEYDLKLSYIKSLFWEHSWFIDGVQCGYPLENCEDVLKCFYYIVPTCIEKTAEAMINDKKIVEDNTSECKAFRVALSKILKMYYIINGREGEASKSRNCFQVLMNPTVQGVFSAILNQDNRYAEDDASDELYVVFDEALTKCYESIRRFVNCNKGNSEKLQKILGQEVVDIINNNGGELKVLLGFKN